MPDRSPILLAVTRYPSAPPARRDLFEQFCQASLVAAAKNAAAVVRVYDTDEPIDVKRQRALDDAHAEGFRWIFHCDDDVVLALHALVKLRQAIEEPRAAVAYSDYIGLCLPGATHPLGPVFAQRAAPWGDALWHRNLVSTMSLFDVEQLHAAGVCWCPSMHVFDDWDFALQIATAGLQGAHVPEPLFHAYYAPGGGITSRAYASSDCVPAAMATMKAKYPKVVYAGHRK